MPDPTKMQYAEMLDEVVSAEVIHRELVEVASGLNDHRPAHSK